jgi:hypothetical protein
MGCLKRNKALALKKRVKREAEVRQRGRETRPRAEAAFE